MVTTRVQNAEGQTSDLAISTSKVAESQSTTTSIYIPPEGVRFRLMARDSKRVMYSRAKNEPLVGHYLGGEYNDQIFTLIYGKDHRKGLYAIKSWECGKVLFSRTHSKPYVGNTYGDGDYADNWFRFEQDRYDKDSFRIYCPDSKTVIYSRTSGDPTFGNYTGGEHTDQLWRFVPVH